MTVVLPSVSTAGNCRMIAFRRAMRATPIANTMVTAAGSPSGMAPTHSATAAMNICPAGSPRVTPSANVAAPSARMPHSSHRPKRASLRVSGVAISVASAISDAMRPVSVRSPVAQTTPSPWPLVTRLPANARFFRSANSVSRPSGSACFATGTDSPVSADSSTPNPHTRTSRRSAPIRSPGSSNTTSPGTSTSASTRRTSPSRRTVTQVAIIRDNASIACTAFVSWRNPTTALANTTPRITAASIRSPRNAMTAAAPSNNATSGCRNCRTKRTHGGVPGRAVMRLGPSLASRRRASASGRPVRISTSSSRNTSSPGK